MKDREMYRIRIQGELDFIQNAESGCIRQRLEDELKIAHAKVKEIEQSIGYLPGRILTAKRRIQQMEQERDHGEALLMDEEETKKRKHKTDVEIARLQKRLGKLREIKRERDA